MGGFQDLSGQNSQQFRVSEMGSHVSARVLVHLRSGRELQQFSGTHRHGLQGKHTYIKKVLKLYWSKLLRIDKCQREEML